MEHLNQALRESSFESHESSPLRWRDPSLASNIFDSETFPDLKTLRLELTRWYEEETSNFDALVENSGSSEVGNEDYSDLWDSMPELDSKAVARSSPIFVRYLGIPLEAKIIRPGGYESADQMINHLVPKMLDRLQSDAGCRLLKKESHDE